MNIDGRALAEEVYTELLADASKRSEPARLGILVGSSDPVIESFVRIKTRAATRIGVELIRMDLPGAATTEDALASLQDLSARVDGVIVQLPLPSTLDIETLLGAIPREKDVDGLNPHISYQEQKVHAPVAEAIRFIVRRAGVETRDTKAVVVGSGRLVGAPTAQMLSTLGCIVSIITRESGSLAELKDADIIVLGAGDSHFLKPDMITEGCVLLDAGTSEQSGKVVGDADPLCAKKCALFTPVPGGIGPVAVAMIFKNLFTLIEK